MQANDSQPGFFVRLKQHHIYRVAAAYGAAIAVLIQIVARAFPYFGWSAAVPAVIIILIAGFPVALVIAWLWVKPADAGEQSTVRKRNWKLGAIVTPIVIAAVVVSGIYAFRFSAKHQAQVAAAELAATTTVSSAPSAATVIPPKSIAVLPFENLSADKNNEYFVEGMQDLILTKLADIGDLKVIARTSTESYGSHPENLSKVGEQLGVATLLEGSVQKAGNQVLINVQLIDAKTDAHIWAHSYQRTLTNIFGVEGEVAERVAQALKVKLVPTETARLAAVPTRDPAAYDLYLKAQRIFNQVGASGFGNLSAAIAAYQAVLQKDPNFALAWSQLAFVQMLTYWGGADRSPTVVRGAEANVRKALALQPNLPQAHLVLGYVYRWGYDDYARAMAEYRLAAAGLPNSAGVAEAIGYIYFVRGNVSAAIAQLQRATLLDPRDPHLPSQLAIAHMAVGQYALARQALQQAFAIDPSYAEAFAYLVDVDLLQTGDTAAALTLLNRAPAAIQSSGLLLSRRIRTLLLQRHFSAARSYLQNLHPGQGMSALQIDQIKGNVLWLSGAHGDAATFYAKALALLKAELPNTTRPLQVRAELAVAAARIGHAEEARKYAREMKQMVAGGRLIPYDLGITPWATLARAYASIGDNDDAIEALHRTLARKSGYWMSPALLRIDPTWDPIRHDLRFQALLNNYVKDKPVTQTSASGERAAKSHD